MERGSSRAALVMDASRPARWTQGWEDLSGTVRRWRLIWRFAAMDILERYRGSVLGPFWLTLSTAILILALGIVYSRLFGLHIESYMPWLATSIVIWTFLSTTAIEGCSAFISQDALIRQWRLPFGIYVARVLLRNMIAFLHALPIALLTNMWFGISFSWKTILLIPSFAIITITGFFFIVLVATVCARFRDIPQVVSSFFQILFFLTPVIWKPDLLGDASGWVWLNPMHALMELLRAPLLGSAPPPIAWGLSLATAVVCALAALPLFVRYRTRIPYWM